MMMDQRKAGKMLQYDWDFIMSQSDDECCFSLSQKEVQILLTTTEAIGWRTRWVSSGADVNQDTIDALQNSLEYKLMSGCCPDDDALHRYGDDGVYETSTDGGDTWEDDPANDPRNSYVGSPPLPGTPGEELKCAAADNVRDLFKGYRDSLVDLLTAGTPFIGLIAGILAFIGAITGVSGVGIGLSVLITGLAAALLTLTPESVAEQISDEVLETFKCLVYCRLEDNGQITYDNWVDMLADIAAEFTGFPETFFYQTVNGMGYIGISNAGTIGAATDDVCDCGCSDCGCDITAWSWIYPSVPGNFTRHEDTCEITSDASPHAGEYYIWGLEAAECCFVGIECPVSPAGGYDFIGIIACDYEGEYSWAVENVGWISLPAIPDGTVAYKAVTLRFHAPADHKAVFI